VLGLGALIQAFPYNSPPPHWMPEALTTLSLRAANDPGVVGSSVKSIISEFKKTRQDTWHIDAKASYSLKVPFETLLTCRFRLSHQISWRICLEYFGRATLLRVRHPSDLLALCMSSVNSVCIFMLAIHPLIHSLSFRRRFHDPN
jgi:Domain of unknown function (DUF3437).